MKALNSRRDGEVYGSFFPKSERLPKWERDKDHFQLMVKKKKRCWRYFGSIAVTISQSPKLTPKSQWNWLWKSGESPTFFSLLISVVTVHSPFCRLNEIKWYCLQIFCTRSAQPTIEISSNTLVISAHRSSWTSGYRNPSIYLEVDQEIWAKR